MYQKTCHVCEKPFESASRNTKYCQPNCLEKSRTIHHARGKRKRNYRKDPELFRRMSMSRKQAREQCFAVQAITCCVRCGTPKAVQELEDHHMDGDPFNNLDSNLAPLCKKCHAKSDTEWRKAKDENKPIENVRHYVQVGAVVLGEDGKFHILMKDLAPV